MYHVRTTKTASKATAVQVVTYSSRKKIIVKHIGSAHTPQAIATLKQVARSWIEQETLKSQQPLFPLQIKQPQPLITMDMCEYLDTRYTFMYEALTHLLCQFQFDKLNKQLLLDLVIMRIIQPVSKLESLEYLSEMFGIQYQRGHLYEAIAEFPKFADTAQANIVAVAKKHFAFDFSIVFYDVTTLYYESFKEDEDMTDEKGALVNKGLRRNGFSKDNKSNQPQIVIGLIVTREGFPVACDVFEGNTFEGKTFIPTITKFKETNKVKTITVVADAAMISYENVQLLIKSNLAYIVGARMANLKPQQIKQISTELIGKTEDVQTIIPGEIDLLELTKRDATSMRIETERGLLVCDFSLKRYRKDKREMEKQIARAEKLLQKNGGLKRTKFIKNKDKEKTEQIINTELIEKTKLLLGIKGYYTNLTIETNKTIIDHYHSLWHVEKAFRIAKSDLAMRPIFHVKRQTIEAHILICFMALAVCKYMELKTGKSTKKIVKSLKSITEARMKNKLTGEIFVMRKALTEEIAQLWKTLAKL